jgi:hypothetical protein
MTATVYSTGALAAMSLHRQYEEMQTPEFARASPFASGNDEWRWFVMPGMTGCANDDIYPRTLGMAWDDELRLRKSGQYFNAIGANRMKCWQTQEALDMSPLPPPGPYIDLRDALRPALVKAVPKEEP